MITKIRKKQGVNIIDFVMNYKGSFEKEFITFMMDQKYETLEDYDNADNIIRTKYNENKFTKIPIKKNDLIATETNDVFIENNNHSFDKSFTLSFDS